MEMHNLAGRFNTAGLKLVQSDQPFARLGQDVFQMDIRREQSHNPRSEYFVMWPGHQDNLAVVLGVDRAEQQLVLLLKEPSRVFFEPVPRHLQRRHPRELAERARVPLSDVVSTPNGLALRRTSPEDKRHMLVGRDERQLFMCRLPRACTTVTQAHAALRAPEATSGRHAGDRSIRQGEWFFIPLGAAAAAEVAAAVGGVAVVQRKASIGSVIPRAGKPHVADELVVLRTGKGELSVYVRGAVRHVDHRTIHLSQWRQVVRNREVDGAVSLLGARWID